MNLSDKISFEKFLELDQHEEELFKTSESIGMADYVINRNNYPDDVYHKMIEDFFEANIKGRMR